MVTIGMEGCLTNDEVLLLQSIHEFAHLDVHVSVVDEVPHGCDREQETE